MGLFKKKKQPECAPEPQETRKSPLDEMDPTVRPGGVFMVQLLMKEKCETPSIERMTEVLERHIGKVDAAKPTDDIASSMKGLALFAALDHIAKFSNGEGPVQVSFMPCDTFHPEKIDEMKRSQMWDCLQDRDRILSECKYCIFANDMLTGALDPLERADFDMDPNWVVRHAYSIASYCLENRRPIKDGDTVDGVAADGNLDQSIQWKCRFEDALIGPGRPVLDINMAQFAAGGR